MWELFWAAGRLSLDNLNAHTGAQCMSALDEGGPPTALLSYYSFPVVSGQTYEMTGWVKSSVPLPGTATDAVDIYLITNDSEVGPNYFQPGATVAPGSIVRHSTTTAYQKLTTLVTIPVGHTWARISPRSYSTATVRTYWDDFTLNTPAVYASSAAGSNLIVNPGFETASTFYGWNTGWADLTGATSIIDTSDAHSGNQSASVTTVAGPSPWVLNVGTAIVVTPGAKYDFSVWAKTSTPLAGTGMEGIGLWVLCGPTPADADYFAPYSQLATGPITDHATTTGWVKYSTTVTIPAGCSFARPSLRVQSASVVTAHWDDASFTTSPV